MKKILDIYIVILISVILIIVAHLALQRNYEFATISTFSGVIIANGILISLLIQNKFSYFDAIMVIFVTLFFIIAPIIQLKNGYFPIPFPINEEYVRLANICNTIFILSYCIFRYSKIFNVKKNKKNLKEFKISKSTLRIMEGIFFIYFIPNLPKIFFKIMYRQNIDFENQVKTLLINKFIMFIPLFCVFYYIIEYKKNNSHKNLMILIFWIIILLICKNPFNEKRNALGPIYLSILLFMIIKKYNCKKFLVFMSIVIVIGFPLSSTITHSNVGLIELISNGAKILNLEEIGKQFTQLHFDAFENLNVIIDYSVNHGISMGKQLLGAIFFFVPRSLWMNKPLSTGIMTGDYLISDYGFNFNNLSSPITAEAYINYGILGLIIFAFIISKWGKITYKWLEEKNYKSLVSWYMIIHLFFLLRGDLMNGIAYLMGPLTAIYFLPCIIEKFKMKKERKV